MLSSSFNELENKPDGFHPNGGKLCNILIFNGSRFLGSRMDLGKRLMINVKPKLDLCTIPNQDSLKVFLSSL